jgi:putative hydrolase of the HAD superfamily
MTATGASASRSTPLRAVTFDYWDTLYAGAVLPERKALRQTALRRMLADLGHAIEDEEFSALDHSSAQEADRWWREEQRGYTAAERIRWMLQRLSIERPADCEHVARAVQAVDDALLAYPPPLLPGAEEAVRTIAARYRLGIISDTGFASGKAQDDLLARDGLRPLFDVTVYSVDIGHAKPRREPFEAGLEVLGLAPNEVVHIGDNERTDVRGALDVGMRAIRVDFIRQNGPSAAEFVARSFDELTAYLAGDRAAAARDGP